MLIPKNKPIRDKKWRMFISSLPCCKCKIVGYTQAAHVYKGGMGMKGHDYVIPLCTIHYENGNMVLGCHEKLDRHLDVRYWDENIYRAQDVAKKAYELYLDGEDFRSVFRRF